MIKGVYDFLAQQIRTQVALLSRGPYTLSISSLKSDRLFMPPFTEQNNVPTPRTRNKKKIVIIGGVIVIMLVLIGFGIIFLLKVGPWSVTETKQKLSENNGTTITSKGVPVTGQTDYTQNPQKALQSVYDSKAAHPTDETTYIILQTQVTTAAVHEDWPNVVKFGSQILELAGHSTDIGALTNLAEAYRQLNNQTDYKATLTKLKVAYEAAKNTNSEQYKAVVKALGT